MNKYAITAHLREVCQEGTVLGVIKKTRWTWNMKANTALSTAAPRGCCRNPPSSWTKSSECLPTSLPKQSVVWKRFEAFFLWKEKKAPKTENGNRRKSESRTIFASFTLWSTMSYTASLRAFWRSLWTYGFHSFSQHFWPSEFISTLTRNVAML